MSRRIDGLVGVHLFGHMPSRVEGVLYNPPYYSTDWKEMELVIKGMAARPGWYLTEVTQTKVGFIVTIDGEGWPFPASGSADTLPMAVALAALQALGVEVGGGEC